MLQQELLWLLHDLGHLDKYPMALGSKFSLKNIFEHLYLRDGRSASKFRKSQIRKLADLQNCSVAIKEGILHTVPVDVPFSLFYGGKFADLLLSD